jgi:ABC-2 type transport system permease protein
VSTAAERMPPGSLVAGPSAAGGDWRRFLTLTLTLAVTEFKLKFFGSLLGYLWQLMRPLMLFGVLFVVFTEFVRIGDGVPFYGVVLLTNIVMFTFVAEATSASVGALVDRENLVRKVQFPRLAIPLSVVTTAAFNLLLNFVAVLVFIAIAGVEPRWTWLEVPALLLMLAVMVTGFSMLISALYVRARDVRPIWDVALQVAFYGSPVIYVIELLPSDRLQQLMMLNPLAVILQQMRHALIDPGAGGAAAVAGGFERLLPAFLFVIGVFALGLWVFRREAPRVAEEL